MSTFRAQTRVASNPARGCVASFAVLSSALVGAVAIALLGLIDFSFTDYEAEAKPAIDRLLAGDVPGYLDALPGYAGAVLLQAPFAALGNLVGPDHDVWAWRAQALPGMALLVGLGLHFGRRIANDIPGRIGLCWGCVTGLLFGGAPFALLAQQTGHPEELLIAGLTVLAVLLATRGQVVTGAMVVGVAAAAKPWAVIAVPVVLLAAADRRMAARAAVACAIAGAILLAPSFASGGISKVSATAHAATSTIFKPNQLFWFAGRANPDWRATDGRKSDELFQADATKARWAQRLAPAWAARVSHPGVVGFAVLLTVAYWIRRRRRPRFVVRKDLLLLLSTICWWRCLLDTWNVHYYALGALLALAAWEAQRGRPPLASCLVTTLAWATFQIFSGPAITPDVQTIAYLFWALPLGVLMIVSLIAPALTSRVGTRLRGPIVDRAPTLARAARITL